MRSPSNYNFATVPRVQIPRSVFKRDRTLKTSFNSGELIPFYWDEVLPGDTFTVKSTMFGRLSTPVCPFMDNVYLDTFYFYVPYRLIWEHWNRFLGEQENPGDSTDYLTPILKSPGASNVTSVASGSLGDYFGLPVGTFGSGAGSGLEINAFLMRAYAKVWNDHFRDENLQDRVYCPIDDGPDDITKYQVLRRGKRKDYFTSCLPWPQKGPGAEISIGGTAPVWGDGNALAFLHPTSPTSAVYLSSGLDNTHSVLTRNQASLPASGSDAGSYVTDTSAKYRNFLGVVGPDANRDSGLYADLSSSTPISINDLRMAFQLQRFFEKDARSGTRLPEIILGHFGVVCPDFRLQRSEYLGGGEIPISVHQIAQNSATNDVSPQGNMAAYGVMSGRSGFSKSFVEHGVVIGLCAVRADLNYQQGLERMLSRRSKFDFYWPELAHLGEQAVLNKEIYASGDQAIDNAAFGYQERWAEYRYGISHITGKLRSGVSGSLDVWHLADYYLDTPQLSAQFIEDRPPLERVLAVQGEPQIILDSLTQVNSARPMPVYSVPGLIDHF